MMTVILETNARVVGNLYCPVFEERGGLYRITEIGPQFFPEGKHVVEHYYGVLLPPGRLMVCLKEIAGLSFGAKAPFSSVVRKCDGSPPEVSFRDSTGETVCLGEGNAAMIRIYARDRGRNFQVAFTIKEYRLRFHASRLEVAVNVRRGDFSGLARHFPQYQRAMFEALQGLRQYVQTLDPDAGSEHEEVGPAARA